MRLLNRQENETAFEHHRRLVYGKLVDRTLADVDFSELSPILYGTEYNSHSARKMMYGSCRTLQLLDEERNAQMKQSTPQSAMDELDAKRIELQKATQRFYDQRNAFNKEIRERARQEELNDVITRAIQSGRLPTLSPAAEAVHIAQSDNDLLVSLNDIHFGAQVDNYWCKYNSKICSAMMEKYICEIISIAKTHGSKNLIIWANGDLISGNIHYQISVSNNENVIEQVTGVSELIASFIATLSQHFTSVKYVSVAGNHSRLDIKDKALINERLDDLVEWYLKARLQNFRNVEIGYGQRIDSTMYVVNVWGKNYVGVHGDYDPSPQHIQALQTMVGIPVYAVLMGHKHHNAIGNVQGIKTIMAGSFLGMDDYCIQKRIYGRPEQMVCVCDASGIRCSYDIDLALYE